MGTKLYVGDINKLWVVDMTNPTGAKHHPERNRLRRVVLASPRGLSGVLIDVALDASGNVYAVDATGSRSQVECGLCGGRDAVCDSVVADTLAGASGINVDGTKARHRRSGHQQVLAETGGISTANLDGSGLKRLVNSSKMTLAYQGIEKDTTANKYMIASPGDKVVYSIDPTSGASTILRDNLGRWRYHGHGHRLGSGGQGPRCSRYRRQRRLLHHKL